MTAERLPVIKPKVCLGIAWAAMAMRTKPRAPQTLAVMENAHFSDSASSHNGASDDESHLQYTATGLGGDALAKQGSGKRRRSGGLPSLISKSGSRSNLGIDAGITRAHEIRRQVHTAVTSSNILIYFLPSHNACQPRYRRVHFPGTQDEKAITDA